MLEFLYQEEFWMETFIAALITGICGLIGGLIGGGLINNGLLKSIRDNCNTLLEHKEISNEHRVDREMLSKEHQQIRDDISGGKSLIIRSLDENKEINRTVEKMLVEDKAKSEFQYNNLTEKQKGIIDSVSNLQYFAKEMKILQEEKNNVLEENKNLRAENSNLKMQCQKYIHKISDLTEEKVPHNDRGFER